MTQNKPKQTQQLTSAEAAGQEITTPHDKRTEPCLKRQVTELSPAGVTAVLSVLRAPCLSAMSVCLLCLSVCPASPCPLFDMADGPIERLRRCGPTPYHLPEPLCGAIYLLHHFLLSHLSHTCSPRGKREQLCVLTRGSTSLSCLSQSLSTEATILILVFLPVFIYGYTRILRSHYCCWCVPRDFRFNIVVVVHLRHKKI